jgi:spore germination protein KC
MNQLKNTNKIIYLSLLLFLLAGCWDQRETEEQAYVIAIGMDKTEENENRVKITYLIANPEAGSSVGGGNSNEPPREIISFVADDFITSRNLANMVIAKQITYDILKLIIVSEEFARDEDFIRWMYDATKEMEIRRDSKLLITKEDTATFLINNQPYLETRPHEYFQLIFKRGTETGMMPSSDLTDFFRITEADADLFLGIYGTTEKKERPQQGKDPEQVVASEFYYEGETNPTQFAGSAVFKEGKMIDTLTMEETRLSFMLNPTLKAEDLVVAFPDPFNEHFRMAARVSQNGELDIEMNLKTRPAEINVTLPISVGILSNHSMTQYQLNHGKKDTLKKEIKTTLEKKFESLVKTTQEEYKTEPFGWSLIARKKFSTLPEWVEFDWMKTYPEMNINVSVDVKLEEFGRQGDLPSLQEVRD